MQQAYRATSKPVVFICQQEELSRELGKCLKILNKILQEQRSDSL